MAKNTGKVREFCQSGKVGTLRIPLDRDPPGQTPRTETPPFSTHLEIC